MSISQKSEAARIRERLGYPIIDADGHMLELDPIIWDYMRQIGGSEIQQRFMKYLGGGGTTGATMPHSELGDVQDRWLDRLASAQWAAMTWKERRDSGTMAPFWWFLPTANTRYRATSHLPKLFYSRLDEFGLDVSVLFPTLGVAILALPGILDDELRRVATRAYNMYVADMYGEYSDRLLPAAAIPMYTPQEALDELEYAVVQRGLRVTVFPSYVIRDVKREAGNERLPEGRLAPYRFDLFAIDSEHDYDPVWKRCVELGVAPCFHSTANGIPWATRNSPSNLMFNTIGNFAESGDAIAKALFMGGVTRRFPSIRFGLLEGGVMRGLQLYAGMVGFWHKRNPKALHKHTDPRKLDLGLMSQLLDEYGNSLVAKHKDEIMGLFGWLGQEGEPASIPLDDWAPAQIERAEDFKDLFLPHFYYGCEADDPTVASAFDTRVIPFGGTLRPFMGSDISHADVLDPMEVVPEAYELIEHGLLNEAQFKDFVFGNAVRLYGGMNPDFFKGTPAEAAATKLLTEEGRTTADGRAR